MTIIENSGESEHQNIKEEITWSALWEWKRNMEDKLRKEIEENFQREFNLLDTKLTLIEDEIYMLKHNQKRPRPKKSCNVCGGTGIRYISPVEDCGQDNKCFICNGEKFI